MQQNKVQNVQSWYEHAGRTDGQLRRDLLTGKRQWSNSLQRIILSRPAVKDNRVER